MNAGYWILECWNVGMLEYWNNVVHPALRGKLGRWEDWKMEGFKDWSNGVLE